MLAIRAVLFDLGDTLLQFGDINHRALFRQAARRTYRLWSQRCPSMPDYRRYYLHQWFAIHWGFFKQTIYRHEVDAMRLIRRACRKLWLDAPDDFFRELVWQWYAPLAEQATLESDCHRVLQQLTERGYQLALVSNTFVPGFVLDRHLTELGLIQYFPQRIYSCDVGYRKPDRRIFELALQRVGVEREQAIFVGDLIDADIAGARRAGITPIWKRPNWKPTAVTTLPELHIDHLHQLLPMLDCFTPRPLRQLRSVA